MMSEKSQRRVARFWLLGVGCSIGVALWMTGLVGGCGPAGSDAPVMESDPMIDASTETPDQASVMDAASPDLAMAVGCTGKSAMTAGTVTKKLTSGGKERTYLLHIPTGYDPRKPTSLVFAFHGLSDKAPAFLKGINLESEADKRNMIAIAPQGLGVVAGWNAGNCCGEPQLFKIDDVAFVRDMIDATKKELCVDEKRIYAMGFSNGGMFSHRLACELSGVISAVGPVSGTLMFPTCKPDRAVSIYHIHGNADPVVGYDGGGSGGFPKVKDVIAQWAQRDGCMGMPQQVFQMGSATCDSYKTCAEGSEVTLCTIDKGQHTWPGSDGNKDLAATPTLLDYFLRHSR